MDMQPIPGDAETRKQVIAVILIDCLEAMKQSKAASIEEFQKELTEKLTSRGVTDREAAYLVQWWSNLAERLKTLGWAVTGS